MVRAALRYLTFPVLVGGSTVATILALDAGIDSQWVVAAIAIASVVLVAALERIIPYVPAYNHSHGDVTTDVMHNLVSGIALPTVLRPLSLAALQGAAVWLTATLGTTLWPSEQPLVLQLGLALVICELGSYWFHRLEHVSPLWWRIHAAHHSAPRLYWLNGGRFHPFDSILSYAAAFFPLILLGAPETTLACTVAFITTHGLLQHSNVDLKLGPLNWIFANAELHRWHHSPITAESNHNYGVVLILWDLIFGTRFLPADRKPPEDVGIGTMRNFPPDYLGQLTSPFRIRQIERAEIVNLESK